MKRKPKVWRGWIMPNGQVWPCHNVKAPANCTVIPDGAPLPMAREVGRVVRAARAWAKVYRRDYGSTDAVRRGILDAIAALDRARKGK